MAPRHAAVEERGTNAVDWFQVISTGRQMTGDRTSGRHPLQGCAWFLLVFLAYSSTKAVAAVLSSERLENFYRTTRRHIQEATTLHRRRWMNLKSK
jgi:hypothetical protein